MSGGSWEYVYHHFDEAADRLERSDMAERRALGKLVRAVGKAMHDIEWVDSSDCSPGDELEAIRLALGKHADVMIGRAVVAKLEAEIATAQNALDRLRIYTGENR